MRILTYACAAAIAYLVLIGLEYIRTIPSQKDLRTPTASDSQLYLLAHRMACEELFPGSNRHNDERFERWREFYRVELRSTEKPMERERLRVMVENKKGRYDALPRERASMKRECELRSYEVSIDARERAREVLINYNLCAEVVDGFDDEHSGELKAWKDRNAEAVERLLSRKTRRSDWRRGRNTFHERELRRLRQGNAEMMNEQVAFCRGNVVRWLRSGT